MVKVEERPLRTFKQDVLAGIKRALHQVCCVGDVRAQALAPCCNQRSNRNLVDRFTWVGIAECCK